jgi:hypothetical protein
MNNPAELQIPSWCPPNISSLAQSLYKKHRASQLGCKIIRRLTTAPEMKRVWHELLKEVRKNYQSTATPRYKANRLFPSQDSALEELFSKAFYIGALNLALPPQETNVDWAQESALKLRADADRILKSLPRKSALPMARHLLKAAKVYERLRYKKRERDKVSGIAINIAAVMKAIFGTPMYETTATITSVVTETPVTGRMVRTWRAALSRPSALGKSNPAKSGKKKP